MRFEPIALGAHLGLGHAQLLVVLLDLLGGAPQVGDVAQDRDDARALARIVDDGRAEQLEQQVRAVARIDQQQLARATAPATGAPRERRREEHVVQRDRAAAALALLFLRREELLGARLFAMISRPSVSVSRIGSVTALMMPWSSVALAVEPALASRRSRGTRAGARCAARARRRPSAPRGRTRRQRRGSTSSTPSRGSVVDHRAVERARRERPRRRCRAALRVAVLRNDGRLQPGEDAHERMVAIARARARTRVALTGRAPWPASADEPFALPASTAAHKRLRGRRRGRPATRSARSRALRDVVGGEEELQQREPLLARRRGRAPRPGHGRARGLTD